MKNRYQIIGLLAITLVIGFVIGFLVHGRMVSHRINTMKNYYNETGFGREIMRIIKPTQEQKELILPILKEHAEENREAMIELREEQKEVFDETIEDLQEILTDEQIKRLEDYWNNRRNRFDDKGPGQWHRPGKPNGDREHRGRR